MPDVIPDDDPRVSSFRAKSDEVNGTRTAGGPPRPAPPWTPPADDSEATVRMDDLAADVRRLVARDEAREARAQLVPAPRAARAPMSANAAVVIVAVVFALALAGCFVAYLVTR